MQVVEVVTLNQEVMDRVVLVELEELVDQDLLQIQELLEQQIEVVAVAVVVQAQVELEAQVW